MWPFKKPRPVRPWYDEPGYLKLPKDKMISITWEMNKETRGICTIDPDTNTIVIFTNRGTYLNKEALRINLNGLVG